MSPSEKCNLASTGIVQSDNRESDRFVQVIGFKVSETSISPLQIQFSQRNQNVSLFLNPPVRSTTIRVKSYKDQSVQ